MSGCPLSRSLILRLAYLDEAGVSSIKEEPILVVAGCIVNADQDWQRLLWHLKAIGRSYLPQQDRRQFVFHAKDIWHGSGYFTRDRWIRETRNEILTKIISIPKEFHLPVVAGFINRIEAEASYRAGSATISDKAIYSLAHSEAYVYAAEDLNFWMKHNALNEVAMLIAENNGQTKAAIKLFHGALVDEEDEFWRRRFSMIRNWYRIIDTVHFAEKHESALLQIADACAFIIKRHLMGKPDTEHLFELLQGQIFSSRSLAWTGKIPNRVSNDLLFGHQRRGAL